MFRSLLRIPFCCHAWARKIIGRRWKLVWEEGKITIYETGVDGLGFVMPTVGVSRCTLLILH
jgi:hypothetical protein